jgi:cytosine/uracil/thiamine/allantoin permease
MVLILGSAGLVIHAIIVSAAIPLGGVRRMRLLSTVGLYAIAGYALLWLWQVLTGPEPVSDHLQFALMLVPFLASAAALGLVVWALLGRGSNSAPHTDAREAAYSGQQSQSRAGGRER